MPEDRHELGALLRQHRISRGLDRKDLAKATRGRVSESTIKNIELGVSKQPQMNTVRALAEALGLRGADAKTFFSALYRDPRGAPGVGPASTDPANGLGPAVNGTAMSGSAEPEELPSPPRPPEDTGIVARTDSPSATTVPSAHPPPDLTADMAATGSPGGLPPVGSASASPPPAESYLGSPSLPTHHVSASTGAPVLIRPRRWPSRRQVILGGAALGTVGVLLVLGVISNFSGRDTTAPPAPLGPTQAPGDCAGDPIGAFPHRRVDGTVVASTSMYRSADGAICAELTKSSVIPGYLGTPSYLSLRLCDQTGIRCEVDQYIYSQEAGPVTLPAQEMCVRVYAYGLTVDGESILFDDDTGPVFCPSD